MRVLVLIALAGIRMTARWLPRAVLVAGAVALLGLAAMNPERLIADRNIDRYQQAGSLDTDYLLGLSADVESALKRLPESIQVCARYRDDARDAWYEFNLSRSRASTGGTPAGDVCGLYWWNSR